LTPIGDKSGAEQKWKEKELVEALYPQNERVTLATDEREVVGDFAPELHASGWRYR
jgi:hypothetical protein